jgi:hypothetical protein
MRHNRKELQPSLIKDGGDDDDPLTELLINRNINYLYIIISEKQLLPWEMKARKM